MKLSQTVALVAGIATIAVAWQTFRNARAASSAAPPSSSLWNAQQNPHGFTWSASEGAYVRVLPNGVKEYYT